RPLQAALVAAFAACARPVWRLPALPARRDPDDPHVVAAATGGQRPVEAAVGRARAAAGVVAHSRELARGAELPPARLDLVGRPDHAVVGRVLRERIRAAP